MKNQEKQPDRNQIDQEEPGQSICSERCPPRDAPRQSEIIPEGYIDTRISKRHPNRSEEMSEKKQT